MPENAEPTQDETPEVETQDGATPNPEAPEAEQASQGTEETVNDDDQGSDESPLWEGIAEDHPVRSEVERLRRENASRRTAAQQTKTENEELQSKLAEAKTADEVSELVTEWQSKVDAKEAEILRERVARQYSVPDDYVEFLTASDEEGLTAQAQKLRAHTSTPPSPEPSGGRKPAEGNFSAAQGLEQIKAGRR